MTKELKMAAKSLRENKDIIIRRGDKSNVFVIMNREEYRGKVTAMLSDQSKFTRIGVNPCNDIKKRINNLIIQINSTQPNGKKMLNPIVGDYTPGFMYGNVKTHKPGNNLRLITSQIPSPTYKVSKEIDSLIKKYLPQGYMLKSSSDFIDLLQGQTYDEMLYSLDVEALFTNVPVNRTIDIILDNVYNHQNIPPPAIPRHILKELLDICTTKVPFRDPDGKMYVQCDGVIMGSPLGVTFANFFMSVIENRVLNNISSKPSIYCRYIDDIFLVCSERLLNELKNEMCILSGLNFTVETSVNNKLPFLNVLVEKGEEQFKTTVYRKPTDIGACMNAKGDCPEQYKSSIVKGFLYRAEKLTTYKRDMLIEFNRAKQILVNNGFSNKLVDNEIKNFLKRDIDKRPKEVEEVHNLYYQNYMNSGYRQDEVALKEIIKDNIKIKKQNGRIKLVIYYKTRKSSQFFMKNNNGPKTRDLATTNVIYDFNCQKDECLHLNQPKTTYTGATTCTLSRRISLHLQNGAILSHSEGIHRTKPTRKDFEEWTKIRYIERDTNRLFILEALIIRQEDPFLNLQDTGKKRTLKLFGNL